ncbi:helicase-related protein [Gordonia aichiensis]|uniref:Putative helicase n=1 Tax=Gordonia aichiensis NBRC 108223 TaxID=1220583 RepID=L7KN31_9ACTN|nr:helicase-related protein [Gordonia aichiensis]GAC49103.1 putative helicase [Gordonia aichiensis NBRC 108223]
MRLRELVAGLRLQGRWPAPVEVLSVSYLGDSAASIVVRSPDGTIDAELVYPDELGSTITVVDDADAPWSFTADPAQFRLAAEALRIRMAGVHDPMLAVATSDISPLPHQIRAVYGELLPRTPLRFLLADDPGAGKTVMAGLYAKELILRGDLARMLIVAPGGLVDQWQDELDSKFGIATALLSRELIDASVDGDPFAAHPFLIARMDQLARDDELLEKLTLSEWDLVVVDEAHRMSANWWGGELRKTKRFNLGQLLGGITRHLLLMTATPHAGSEENFQAFLSLLDPDRFEGQPRGSAIADTTGLMRRMVKEELLTFEGRPLFPERVAETVPYRLSDEEQQLYDAVTHYVREEMNRAEANPDSPQRRTVGFALTVLQRRLASSTHAILRSLERRRHRLATKRAEMAAGRHSAVEEGLRLPRADQFDDPDEWSAEEFEHIEEEVVDAATAARTVAELDVEIALLDDLIALATRVRNSGVDRKWAELRTLLADRSLLRDSDGAPRKLIIFTEHRDTLEYLARQIRNVLGDDDAVLTIHGGTRRTDRKAIRELFTQELDRRVLVATDAAGEGLNLQAAHLMINYDLPWNPNRLEQRFGRIHRIGQEHVCRLWNIVADETREGQVFVRLLDKMEQQRKAYGGKLFDVLGDAFAEKPLRELLMDAIRYGDDPARIAEIERVVDAQVAEGCEELINDRALARETLDPLELDRLRREMDDAMARRLQPHYIEAFFTDAFGQFGGRLTRRERQRFQISNVPASLRQRPVRREHAGRPVVRSYERVTFDPTAVAIREGRQAELLAPGHPLFDAVLDTTIERAHSLLEIGTTLFDPLDTATEPYVLMAMTGEIHDGHRRVVSKRFSFVALHSNGSVADAGPAPHLDLSPLPDAATAAASKALTENWIRADLADRAMGWAGGIAQPAHLAEVRAQLMPSIEKTSAAVRARLIGQINYLDSESARVRESQATGRGRRARYSPEWLEARARELEQRLATRTDELARDAILTAKPPVLTAVMLVIPAGMVGGSVADLARDTTITERRGVDAVLAAEIALGRDPEEMAHNHKGYDIRSLPAPDEQGVRGPTVFIEVKGRVEGADHFSISYSEVMQARNTGLNHRLALVSVSDRGPEFDEIRYLTDYFRNFNMGDTDTATIMIDWPKAWSKGKPPH